MSLAAGGAGGLAARPYEVAMLQKLEEAAGFIRSRSTLSPRVGLILGSGLGSVCEAFGAEVSIPYGEIPHAPMSAVLGHSGKLVLGKAGQVPVAVMQGRVHYYEGHAMEDVLFLPRVLGRLGIKVLVVTNAAGAVNPDFQAGDLMLISDHVNFMGVNPLRGRNYDELGERFPDMTEVYPEKLRKVAREVAKELGVGLKEGVYFALSGPTYETPAEIRMYRTLGADAVGMSTAPEVVALAHMNIPAVGISCITNMAAGMHGQKLNHAEVLETTDRVRPQITSLLARLVEKLPSAL